MNAAHRWTSHNVFDPNRDKPSSPSSTFYIILDPEEDKCSLRIKHRCNAKCFNLRKLSASFCTLVSHTSSPSAGREMCSNCGAYEGHHVGHYHRPGQKVVRRHNGRLVTERLRRPLLHLSDGSELVGYCSSRFGHVGTLAEFRRRGRNSSSRLLARMPGHTMDCGDESDGCYGRSLGGIMRKGGFDHGYDQPAMVTERMPGCRGGCGYEQGLRDNFHNFRQYDRGRGEHRHTSQNCSRYITSDGMSGMVEERVPGWGNSGQGYLH